MQKSMKRYFPIFVLPTLIAFVIAFLYPFIIGIYLSFTEFTTVRDAAWVGINNYKKIFSDQNFINALLFTVKFTIVSVVTINVLGFLRHCPGLYLAAFVKRNPDEVRSYPVI